MTKEQRKLADKHGIPIQFADKVMEACARMMITPQEAEAAIVKYDAEWTEAGNTANK